MAERDIQTEVLKRMSPQQKWHAALRLYWSARRWKAAWIRHQHPDWTEDQVQQTVREVFANART